MTVYSTRPEAVHREIVEPLGEYACEHDVDAIAEELIVWTEATTPRGHVDPLRTGFRLRDVSTAEFWATVERHALPTD